MRTTIITALILFLSSCKLTDESLTGKWVSNWDTLIVNQNHHFYLTKGYKEGNWSVSKRSLILNFTDGNNGFGNCGGLQKIGFFSSRKKLVRFSSCTSPSHHFISYKKVR